MELGLYTFADVDPAGGRAAHAQRMQDLVEEIVIADEVGLDVFGLGEHHRADYLASAPVVALAAGAARTSRIRLQTAVTVLSSEDPVRVWQQFATLDLVSGGRAEIMAGRGSFIESFPLFGYDLGDYDELFTEKLDLLLDLRDAAAAAGTGAAPSDGGPAPVTWQGRHRAALAGQRVWPLPVQTELPVWIAVGGTPQSVVRAGALGLPMMLAIIGGEPERFAPFAELHREAARRSSHDPLPLGVGMHGLVADTSQGAADTFWGPYSTTMGRIGRERGFAPMSREAYEEGRTLRGHLLVGSPDEVVEKLLRLHEIFGMTRFNLQTALGTMPHAAVLRSIELFGTKVAPAVREEIAKRTAAT
ncbi:Atu2307/SP_0267 family LLM class monooxygenase [Kineosporia sp. R_H_3]|uniref:Atu2307/SP_0267 family LLM class monooxygenase n=1 Tax=Kineosporia sp. R_H_3 TaxID=1961848 RepID=UPI000B4B5B43